MAEVIPSINAPTFEEVRERIQKIESYVSWCHLDVTDGIFSKHATWHNPSDLPLLDTKCNVEVHLMIEEPERIIDTWLIEPIKRVIVHLEASKDIDMIISRCRRAGIEIGLAIRPDTFWDVLVPWLQKVDLIQVLAVNPGPSGQQMTNEIVDKVRHLRTACKECILEVDGGINPDTAKRVRAAGASILVSAGYIFSHPDKAEAIRELNGSE
ncbi:MAG: hypothetical protein U1A25_02750 [Candidatus Sungbacteria bacterium]|nr:hypothetical protein [bacterium]MDZ4260561.1 hypothetical protein [Candidatus Sungbacteria bacterium]